MVYKNVTFYHINCSFQILITITYYFIIHIYILYINFFSLHGSSFLLLPFADLEFKSNKSKYYALAETTHTKKIN